MLFFGGWKDVRTYIQYMEFSRIHFRVGGLFGDGWHGWQKFNILEVGMEHVGGYKFGRCIIIC